MVENGREPLRKRLREEVKAVVAAAKRERRDRPMMAGKAITK